MKIRYSFALITVTLAIGVTACASRLTGEKTIAEGVLLSVEYQLENGRTGGFTRLNTNRAVPGGNGSWNVDAYGRLTRHFLIITRPQRKDLGPRIIPTHRLIDVQFGDAGIKHVDENQPAPGS